MRLTKSESAKVWFLDDERSIGNGILVTLRDGWKFSDDPLIPTHVRGSDTVRDAREAIRNAVPCNCETCAKVTA